MDMKLSKIYPLLVAKAIRKGRSRQEVDRIIFWLTGWDMTQINLDMRYGDFLQNAPAYNPAAESIKGIILIRKESMAGMNAMDMKLSKIYPLLVAKAIRKGRSRQEVDRIIFWLTGWDMTQINLDMRYGDFLQNAPAYNPAAESIKGIICGTRVEEIQDPVTRRMRQLDKLIDELAKGKPLEKVLRY